MAQLKCFAQFGYTFYISHKALVPPVFVAYKLVSHEGAHVTLMQIATAVLKSVLDQTSLDVVQPLKQGWYIYMKTSVDRAALVERHRPITIAGNFISLQSDFRPESVQSVKVMIKDLPLHSVRNEEVLKALCPICKVTSPINYSNL